MQTTAEGSLRVKLRPRRRCLIFVVIREVPSLEHFESLLCLGRFDPFMESLPQAWRAVPPLCAVHVWRHCEDLAAVLTLARPKAKGG